MSSGAVVSLVWDVWIILNYKVGGWLALLIDARRS